MTAANPPGPEQPRIDLFAPDDGRPLPLPPRRRRKRGWAGLAFVAGGAVLVGAAALLAVNAATDPARLRAEIERSVTRATGRPFTINGPLHVILGAAPSITADNIALGNVPGGTRAQMMTATSLRAQVALLPLLTGQIVVEQVTLVQPDILLEQGGDGTPNWQFRPLRRPLFGGNGDAAPESRAAAGAREARAGSTAVEVRKLYFAGGHIAWRPLPGSVFGPAIAFDIKTLSLFSPSDDAPMHGKIAGHGGGIDFTADIHAGAFDRLEGGPVTLLAGAWPLTIEVDGAGATLKLDGGVNHPEEMRGYSFELTGNAPDLTPFDPWLPKPLALPLHDVNLTLRMSDGSNGAFHTQGLSLHAGAADLGSAVPGLILKEAVFSAPGPGQQAQLSVQGLFQEAPLRIVGTTTQPDVLAANVPVPVAVSGQVGDASFSGRGTVPPAWGVNGLDLTASLHTPTLANLSPLAGRPLPDVRNVVFESHITDAGYRLRGVDLHDLVLSSSLGDISGDVTFAWAPVPTLNGTLTSKRFDLDAAEAAWTGYVSEGAAAGATTQTPAEAPQATRTPGASPAAPDQFAAHLFSDQSLDIHRLRGANADLTVNAGDIIMGHETYRDLQARVLANDGRLILNPLRVTAPQGLLTGALSLDASIDPPPVAVTLRSPAMSAAGLAAALGYGGAAIGSVQMDAQLSGEGDTPHALAATLTGHFGLTMVNGTVTDTLLEGALGAALNAAGIPAIGGSTDVRCFALRTDFHHGQGEVQALSLDTSHFSVDGNGSLDLADESLALHLRPVLRVGGSGVAAPVLLHGGFNNLKASLEPAMAGGRFGLTIGGPAPNDNACVAELSEARGGMAGPMPVAAPAQPAGAKHKKPADLLRGLFH